MSVIYLQVESKLKLLIAKLENKTSQFKVYIFGKKSKIKLLFDQNRKIIELSSKVHNLETYIKKNTISNKPKLITPVNNIKIPIFIKSKNPLILIYNLKKYLQDHKKFTKQLAKYNALLSKKDTSNAILMDSYTESSRHINIQDKFVRIYYLSDLPSYLVDDVIGRILNLPYPITYSYHIKPTNKSTVINAARKRRSVLEMMQNERFNKGKTSDIYLEKELNEVNAFISDLVYDREKSFLVSIYAQITAKTLEDLKQYCEKFQEVTNTLEIQFNTYSFGQFNAFCSVLPFSNDLILKENLLQTSALNQLMPFLSRNFNDPNGVFIGINHFNNSLLLLDLFKARNANMTILGTSGSGKSVTSKIIITRLVIRGIQCLILDPEGEYSNLVNSLGGIVYKFSKNFGINPFYISEFNKEDIHNHISILKGFFRFFIKEDRFDPAKLDGVLTSLYKNKNPNFEKFYGICKKNYSKIISDLDQLRTGSMAGIFNTNNIIEFKESVVSFDLSDLVTDEKKIPAMYILTAIINRQISQNSRKRMIFIDEAHKLLVTKETIDFYVDLVKTARKRNTGIVSITQNPEDFKESTGAKTILTQAETSIILKQAFASMHFIESNQIFPLTESEQSNLPTLGVGEALLIREKEHIFVDIFPFDSEKSLIYTSN